MRGGQSANARGPFGDRNGVANRQALDERSGGRRGFGSSAAMAGREGASRRFGGPDAQSRGFGHAALARSRSGRTFVYHGHSYPRFEVARYYWPHGYRYRTYYVGYRLPRVFWVHDYYITDYWDYGIDAPPYGFQWIRYGPDLLLIDLTNGAVANVIFGVFEEEE